MKIDIKLKRGFTLRDWKLAKDSIDSYLFKEFSARTHPDEGNSISTMNGPSFRQGGGAIMSGISYNINISNSQDDLPNHENTI